MRTRPTILYFGPVDTPVPDLVRRWADDKSFPLVVLADRDEVESIILRGHPSLLFVDGERMGKEARALVASLKADPFSAIGPVTVLEGAHDPVAMQEWFAAGADEILTAVFPPPEQRARLGEGGRRRVLDRFTWRKTAEGSAEQYYLELEAHARRAHDGENAGGF